MEIRTTPRIHLDIQTNVQEIIPDLDRRGLIRLLKQSFERKMITPNHVDTVPMTLFNQPYVLMDVGMNWYDPKLYSHPDGQEELVIVHGEVLDEKPLFFIFGLVPPIELEKKAKKSQLCKDDFVVVRWPYNDPNYSSFVIPGGVAHCEITTAIDLPAPRFFVVEPQDLILNEVQLEPYTLTLKR